METIVTDESPLAAYLKGKSAPRISRLPTSPILCSHPVELARAQRIEQETKTHAAMASVAWYLGHWLIRRDLTDQSEPHSEDGGASASVSDSGRAQLSPALSTPSFAPRGHLSI